MYSRNINRKQPVSHSASAIKSGNFGKDGAKINKTGVNSKEKSNISIQTEQRDDIDGVVREKTLPVPPPNYRGMIYGIKEITEKAEGIDRLVRNDPAYSENENAKRRREIAQRVKNGERSAFSHTNNVIGSKDRPLEDQKTNGIKRIVEELREKKFLPEDILICALILIMLNGNSEDDILMILVLMMLL